MEVHLLVKRVPREEKLLSRWKRLLIETKRRCFGDFPLIIRVRRFDGHFLNPNVL
jgi:hypothetical protein